MSHEAIKALLNKQQSAGGEEPAETTPSQDAAVDPQAQSASADVASPDEPEAASEEAAEDEPVVEEQTSEESPEEEEDHSMSDRQKERIEKRIGKEVAKRKQAEGETLKAQERVKQLEAELRQKAGPDSPALYDSAEAITGRREEIRKQIRSIQKHIRNGGLTVDDDDDVSVSELEKFEDELMEERDVLLPKMEESLRKREKVEQEQVKKLYPALLDPNSEDYAAAEELMARVPGLRAVPDARLLVGRMLRGQRLEASPKRKPAEQTPRPPVESKGGTEVRSGIQPPPATPNANDALLAAVAARRAKQI